MAQRAIIHPSVPREARGIEDGRSARLRGMRRLKVDVFSPLAMTFFAGDAQAVTAGVTHCTELRLERKRRAATLQTAMHDESSEVDHTIQIARTLYPLPVSCQIRDRPIEQEPTGPAKKP